MSALRLSAMAMLFVSISVIALPMTLADAPKQKSVQVNVFDEGTLSVPADFKRTEVKSRIIEHEFQATAGEGDAKKTARVTMMAAGGDVKANISRWKGQFAGGEAEDQKTEEMKVGDWNVYVVDVTGSYQERTGGPFAGGKVVERTGYAMTGAILVHAEGRKYFVKMIGPQQVIKANRKAFVEMIKGIKE